ncbi:227 kDa spindle- and centromere-associated protein-like isoform X2 [Ostrea edulis]|uniref:227 kDa spindle- and centromere-associated protein-like isoform X2 n=1 Tax=Ostrea edulis TaxID=37623 RepID=UPI0024AFDFDA|nr:227 kDa spindle- and centromere-associated protein-like isoform X2 [Ostrea edulis]
MLKTYPGFLIVWLTVVSKPVYGQTIYKSSMTNLNALDPTVKDQMLSLVEESMRTSFLKLSAQFKDRLDDLRIDMSHRDTELYVEIYNLKETLKRQGFTLESQSANRSELGQESRELSFKLASLEKEIKETSKESENKIKILKKKLDVLENENRMMSSRLDATQMTFMSMASHSSLRNNDSDDVSVDIVHKLKLMDDRLNDLNETIHDNHNSTADMTRLVTTLNSDLMTLNSSIDALNISVNSNSYRITSQENLMKVETKKLIQSGQMCSDGLTVLRGNYNLTMSNIENMKTTQREISSDLKDHIVMVYSLAGSLNTTIEGLGHLEKKLNVNLTNFQMETQSFWKRELGNLQSNISDITNTSNVLKTSIQNLSSQNTERRLSVKKLSLNVSTLQSNVEQLRHEQNETNANMEIRLQQTTTKADNARLLSISTSIRKSVEECEKNISDIQSGNVENGVEIKLLQNQFRSVTSNVSHFQTLISQNSIKTENLTFLINVTRQDHAELRTSVTTLESNFSLLQQNEEKTGIRMKTLDSDWSSFRSQYRMEMNSIQDSVNSTREDYKGLTALSEANSASCQSSVTAVNTSLNQFTERFSSVNASIAKFEQDLTTSKALMESSKFQIRNITTTVEELQTQMNTTGPAVNSRLSSLLQSITNHDSRITNISSIVTSHSTSISSLQSNLNVAVAINNAQNVSISRIDRTIISLVPVRLVGGSTSREGRVEVFNSGTWGTVCDDSWGSADAKVVCRMLGYTGSTLVTQLYISRSYTAIGSAHFGQGSGQIWLDDVACSGSETSIFLCPNSGLGTHNCGHGEDASVRCT